jgi:hypothetical protein
VGDASAKTPHTGQGWVLTTLLTDGVAGADTATRVTSTTDTLSILHVSASPLTIVGHGAVLRFKGTQGITPLEWNGTVFIVVSSSYAAGPPHAGYTDELISGLLSGTISTTYHQFVVSESDTTGGFMSASDSRVT